MKFEIELEIMDIQSEAEIMADEPVDISQDDVDAVVNKMKEIIRTRTDISKDFWETFDNLQREAIYQVIYERMF